MLNRKNFTLDIKKWIIPIVIITILLSRLFFSFGFSSNSLGDDGKRYFATAKNVVYNGIFSYDDMNPLPSSHDAPVFIFLEALILKLSGGENITFILTSSLNAIFFTTTMVGLYLLINRIFKNQLVGLFSIIAFSFIPQTLTYSTLLMPDSLFMTLFVWSYYFLFKFTQEKKCFFLIYSFCLLGISVITKPISLFFSLFQ